MRAPSVSVVMPVRDAAPYLEESVTSILGQSFDDFELVAVDDGSVDESPEILRRLAAQDGRITVHEHRTPHGLVGSSNDAVSRANAPLIARMDADDIAHPDRLLRQVEVFAANPEAVLVGTLFQGIDAGGRVVRPLDRARLLRPTTIPFPHGSAMFRRAAFDSVGGYRPGTEGWEDQDLFVRLGRLGDVLTITEPPYCYRYHARSSTTLASIDEAEARVIKPPDLHRSIVPQIRYRHFPRRRYPAPVLSPHIVGGRVPRQR